MIVEIEKQVQEAVDKIGLKSVGEKIAKIKRIVNIEELTDNEKHGQIREAMLIGHKQSQREMLFAGFMVTVGLLVVVMVPFLTPKMAVGEQQVVIWQYYQNIALALAAGAMAVGFTGNVNVRLHWIQASGSIGVVLMVLYLSPVSWEKQQDREDATEEKKGASISWLIQSANADGSVAETVAQSSPQLGANETELPMNRFKITYPIGISELKKESFAIYDTLNKSQSTKEVKVFSHGSFLNAPLNAWRFDGKYKIQVNYNELIEKSSIESTTKSLGQLFSDQNIEIEAVETNTSIPIEIQLIPK